MKLLVLSGEKRKGPGQQKRGHDMTKEIVVGRKKEERPLVSLPLVVEEAK